MYYSKTLKIGLSAVLILLVQLYTSAKKCVAQTSVTEQVITYPQEKKIPDKLIRDIPQIELTLPINYKINLHPILVKLDDIYPNPLIKFGLIATSVESPQLPLSSDIISVSSGKTEAQSQTQQLKIFPLPLILLKLKDDDEPKISLVLKLKQQKITLLKLKQPRVILLKLKQKMVYVYLGSSLQNSYPVAIGKSGWETPTGKFQVIQMLKNPGWTNFQTGELVEPGNSNPLGERWIAFWTDHKDLIGFHGTPDRASVGLAVSHGCVRMYNEDVRELYKMVRIGTPVIVEP